MDDRRQICTFFVGDQYFGLDVLKVQEIIRSQPMTPAPLAHRVVSGLINLRGQIVTAIDLRRRLGLPDRVAEQPPVNVVVQTEDGAVSLLADEIGDVLEAGAEQYEPPPETLRGTARELILGAYKLDGRLLLVLDAERTASLPNESFGASRTSG